MPLIAQVAIVPKHLCLHYKEDWTSFIRETNKEADSEAPPVVLNSIRHVRRSRCSAHRYYLQEKAG